MSDLQRIVRRALRAEPETARGEIRLKDRLEHDLQRGLPRCGHEPKRIAKRPDSLLPGLGINTRRAGSGRH